MAYLRYQEDDIEEFEGTWDSRFFVHLEGAYSVRFI